jgi:hypothetical protein
MSWGELAFSVFLITSLVAQLVRARKQRAFEPKGVKSGQGSEHPSPGEQTDPCA